LKTRLTLVPGANLAFGLATLILLSVGAYSYQSLGAADETERWVRHTHEVLETLQSLDRDDESKRHSVLRYILSNDEADLRAIHASAASAEGNAVLIRNLTVDNPRQQQRIPALERLLDQERRHIQTIVDLRQSKGLAAVMAFAQPGAGPRMNHQLDTVVGQMRNEELRLLGLRNAREARDLAQTKAVLVIGIVVGLLIGAGASWSVQRDNARRKLAEADLLAKLGELRRSNEELENFTKVASHDLQEPLRMVASYCRLLQRRYQGKLDSDADEFIGYAVEGADRMQRLVNDLLGYSRVGRHGTNFELLPAAKIVETALKNLQTAIADSGAQVALGELPVIAGDPTQLVQLFQNLIGNAVKFRGDRAPAIRIDAVPADGNWVEVTVADNGIGIEPEFVERVFLIFQRLHPREAYEGTGIGLAIVKKVVENHGGRVWIESKPGQGTCFHFTLPTTLAKGES